MSRRSSENAQHRGIVGGCVCAQGTAGNPAFLTIALTQTSPGGGLFDSDAGVGFSTIKLTIDGTEIASMNVDGDVLIAKYWAEEGPIAELCIANHKHAGAEPHPFKVTFRDDGDLDFDSIDADDLRVVAPDGSLLPVELVDTNVRDHTRSTVTFSVAPPMGTWSADDNGIYAVRVLPESIADMDGHLNVGRDIGIFRVGIPI